MVVHKLGLGKLPLQRTYFLGVKKLDIAKPVYSSFGIKEPIFFLEIELLLMFSDEMFLFWTKKSLIAT